METSAKKLPFSFADSKIMRTFALAKGNKRVPLTCKWRFRLAARTHASHAWNTGSIPVGATKKTSEHSEVFFFIPFFPTVKGANKDCIPITYSITQFML